MQTMQNLMIKYLKMNYPVHRIREKRHFKRTIVTESGDKYHLSNKAHMKFLYSKLYVNLQLIFSEDKTLTEDVLKSFLHLK